MKETSHAKHHSSGDRTQPSPADSRIFGFVDFSKNVYFGNFPMGFGVWGGLQSIGEGCGIQIDGFSVHTEPYGSIFDDFEDSGHFGTVSDSLTFLPEGPGTLRECPEGAGTCLKVPRPCLKVPGPCEMVLWWSDATSGRSQDPPRVP